MGWDESLRDGMKRQGWSFPLFPPSLHGSFPNPSVPVELGAEAEAAAGSLQFFSSFSAASESRNSK